MIIINEQVFYLQIFLLCKFNWLSVFVFLFIALDDFETGSSASGPSLEPYGLETVTLRHGEPHVIPCDLGTVGISDHILWYRNGTLSSNRNTVSQS